MAEKGYMVELYDAPDTPEFEAWLYGPHWDEVFDIIPGLRAVRRLEVINPDRPGQQRIITILESDDIDATWAFRRSPPGRASKRAADAMGVHNREEYYARLLREVERPERSRRRRARVATAPVARGPARRARPGRA